MKKPKILIYCDGGLGNRLNALYSGLALARAMDASFQVCWPSNNWCRASLLDLIECDFDVIDQGLSLFREVSDQYFCITHDELSASAFGSQFISAYSFSSIDSFRSQWTKARKPLFYYPALIPEWLPVDLIDGTIAELKFVNEIEDKVADFIERALCGRPYYGVHLRRTDLVTGLSDVEVDLLVTTHRNEQFFVCSDDEMAELRATCHKNVLRNPKQNYVQRQKEGAPWQSQTTDCDGRIYSSNIERGTQSIIDSTVDMLILGHSRVVQVGGSTFRRMAERIVGSRPIVMVERPAPLQILCLADVLAHVKRQRSGPVEALNYARLFLAGGRVEAALSVLEQSLEQASGNSGRLILAELGRILGSVGRIRSALTYYREAERSGGPERVISENIALLERMLAD